MDTNQIQQGDVLFLRINELPKGMMLKRVDMKMGNYVFAEGEATGHHHSCLADPGIELYEDANGTMWCTADKEITVTHQEHGPVTLSPGTYKVGRIVEVDPFEDAVREVAD